MHRNALRFIDFPAVICILQCGREATVIATWYVPAGWKSETRLRDKVVVISLSTSSVNGGIPKIVFRNNYVGEREIEYCCHVVYRASAVCSIGKFRRVLFPEWKEMIANEHVVSSDVILTLTTL